MDDLLGMILGELQARAKNKMGELPIDPTKGFDAAPIPPQGPVIPTPPWTLNVGGGETTLSLPANHGANFEGYINYGFNPFAPRIDFKGAGLRYRYEF